MRYGQQDCKYLLSSSFLLVAVCLLYTDWVTYHSTVECLAECRLRCVARHGDDRFEWQVSCVHEVRGTLHTPALDILHWWFSHYRLEAPGKGGTRQVRLICETRNRPLRRWIRMNGLQCGCH